MDSAWAYLVVSSARQAESLPDQRRWVDDVARTNEWQIPRTFEGVSTGADGVRKIFEQLILALEKTPKALRPARILMIRLDRTGRGLGLEAIAAMARIYELGVKIHTRQDGDLSITRTADVFGPVLRILAGACENEARRDKALRTYENRRAAGKHIGSLAPYGTKLDEEGEPVPLEPQACVVRRAFEMRAAGIGYRTIAQKLNSNSPPKIRRDGTERKMRFHPSSVRYWVNCKTYRGVVVDTKLWDRANAVSNRGFKVKDATRYPWPLGGALRCECGTRLIGNPAKSNWRTGKRKREYSYRYYVCTGVDHAKVLRYRAEELEAQIPAILKRLRGDPNAEKTYFRRRRSKRSEIERTISSTEQQIVAIAGRREHAWNMAAKGGIRDEELRRRLQALDAAEDEFRRTLVNERETLAALDSSDSHEKSLQVLLQDLTRRWRTVSAAHQRAVANALSRAVGGLIVQRNGIIRPFLDKKQDRLQI